MASSRALRALLIVLAALLGLTPAAAQNFPALTGRVVDAANIIPDDVEAALTERLAALQQASSRQLVVATVASLDGHEVSDYGYQLGRHWGIGQSEANNGTILLVAPNERKVTIQVGYGLEPIVTDALAGQIIREQILPRFRENDYPGGITAGVDAIIQQLQAPPEAAEQRALEAARAEAANQGGSGGSIVPIIFWIVVLGFIIVPMLSRGGVKGRRYGTRGRRGRGLPVVIWGPGSGGGWGSGGSSWGGGGSSWGGGGFSGGGGSFGGGGASGGW